jgi:hypothetical protein
MDTAAAIDRLVHHASILEFNVPSYRTRKRGKSDAVKPREPQDGPNDRAGSDGDPHAAPQSGNLHEEKVQNRELKELLTWR